MEVGRYARQMAVPGWGESGQERLARGRVVVLGLGGVGCMAALYLAAAGVGQLWLVDGDRVELSNLHRQVLYTMSDLGQYKARAAESHLAEVNPGVRCQVVAQRVDEEQMLQLAARSDLCLEALDRPADKLAAARAALRAGRPIGHAFVQEYSAEVFWSQPGRSACLGCYWPREYPCPSDIPVTGPAAGMAGILLAGAAIKYLLQLKTWSWGMRTVYDQLLNRQMLIQVERQPGCPLCGRRVAGKEG
ncbi:MAG: HesA/MoeB/ThiF family protein [Desulfurispora sp.]|uniref:HesA/MoeB/ThiF family protein n=1 Tax=Desulfurispora sp. TaxID=3014275 RepID=UPI00404B35BE